MKTSLLSWRLLLEPECVLFKKTYMTFLDKKKKRCLKKPWSGLRVQIGSGSGFSKMSRSRTDSVTTYESETLVMITMLVRGEIRLIRFLLQIIW